MINHFAPFAGGRERRLIFFGAEVPKPVDLAAEKEKAKEAMRGLETRLAESPEAVAKLKIDEAEADQKKFRQGFEQALKGAAMIYVSYLKDSKNKTPEEAMKITNDIFKEANVPLALFALDKKERPQLDDEDKKLIQETLKGNEALIAPAERLVLEKGEPARAFLNNLKDLNPKARREVLSSEQNFQKYLNTLPPDQQEVGRTLLNMCREVEAGGEQLLEDDRKQIVENATKACEKFDAAKATEVERNLMLARLQMAGVDISDPARVFGGGTPGERFMPFEGTPFARSMNKIIGLISYVLLTFQKLKGQVEKAMRGGGREGEKPGEMSSEKPKDHPEAQGGAEFLAKIKESGWSVVRAEKIVERNARKAELDGDPGGLDADAQRGLRGRETDLKKRDVDLQEELGRMEQELRLLDKATNPVTYSQKETQIADVRTRKEKVVVDLRNVQVQRAQREEQAAQIERDLQSLDALRNHADLQRKQVGEEVTKAALACGNPPLVDLEAAKVLQAALNGVTVPDEIDDHLVFVLNGVDVGKMVRAKETIGRIGGDAVSWELDGTKLRSPEAFLVSLKQAQEKLALMRKSVEDQAKGLVERGATPEAGQQAQLLQQNYGLSVDFRNGVWVLTGAEGDAGAVLVRVSRALAAENATLDQGIRSCLVNAVNEPLRDVTSPLGRMALVSLVTEIDGKKWPEWADPKLHEQLFSLAQRIPEVARGVHYSPDTGVVWMPSKPDLSDEVKEKIKTDTLYGDLKPALKAWWGV